MQFRLGHVQGLSSLHLFKLWFNISNSKATWFAVGCASVVGGVLYLRPEFGVRAAGIEEEGAPPSGEPGTEFIATPQFLTDVLVPGSCESFLVGVARFQE